jgi:hypothetical protein
MEEKTMDLAEYAYPTSDAQPPCPTRCQERRRKLCDDLPGVHVYVWACVHCQREFGPDWEEYHHGAPVHA